MKYAISMRRLEIQIEIVVTFLIIFGAHMDVLVLIKVKILVLSNGFTATLPPNYANYWA